MTYFFKNRIFKTYVWYMSVICRSYVVRMVWSAIFKYYVHFATSTKF